jgi:hypothetical protein
MIVFAGALLALLGAGCLLVGMVGGIRKVLAMPSLVKGESWLDDVLGLLSALRQTPEYLVSLLFGLFALYWGLHWLGVDVPIPPQEGSENQARVLEGLARAFLASIRGG